MHFGPRLKRSCSFGKRRWKCLKTARNRDEGDDYRSIEEDGLITILRRTISSSTRKSIKRRTARNRVVTFIRSSPKGLLFTYPYRTAVIRQSAISSAGMRIGTMPKPRPIECAAESDRKRRPPDPLSVENTDSLPFSRPTTSANTAASVSRRRWHKGCDTDQENQTRHHENIHRQRHDLASGAIGDLVGIGRNVVPD